MLSFYLFFLPCFVIALYKIILYNHQNQMIITHNLQKNKYKMIIKQIHKTCSKKKYQKKEKEKIINNRLNQNK